jgi:Asp-tRNA(Asn)/Glu-tRNA(Gln) amidotransferase C subunit
MTNSSTDFEKYFKMAKLKVRPLFLEETLKMINKIQEIDVSGEEPYDKFWIRTKMRKDEIVIDENVGNFQKEKRVNDFFVVSAVVKQGE